MAASSVSRVAPGNYPTSTTVDLSARRARAEQPAPWRWLLGYGLLLLVPVIEAMIRPPTEGRGVVVAVGCVLAAVTLALFVGSRIAWSVLVGLEALAVATLALDLHPGPLLALLRLILLAGSPIRRYVWRLETSAERRRPRTRG